MRADAVGAAARLRTTPAAWFRSAGFVRFRGPILALLALLAGTALALDSTWLTTLRAEAPVPQQAVDRLELVASVIAHEIQATAGRQAPNSEQVDFITSRLPSLALAGQRTIYVSDGNGSIVASTSKSIRPPRLMSDLLSDDDMEPLAQGGRVVRTALRDGTSVVLAVRHLPSGHVAVMQPTSAARLEHSDPLLRRALPIAGLLAICGLAAVWVRYRRNTRRNRMHRTRNHRIDTSLSHGRCGVWDWDTTRHKVFWSPSMYQLLGYEPRGNQLSAGEVIALIHPEDAGMRDLVSALSTQDAGALDREIRVRTAQGDWLWLRIKGETISEPADGSRHLVGLAIDVTAERRAAEQRARDDLRLREAVEALSEAFVLWDEEDRLIVCNSKFLALHGIAGDIAVPGTPSREIMAAGRPALVSSDLDATPSGNEAARKIETQIFDGRWFHVSERRTRDGSLVSVGTDVSELKHKEAKLRARERHLQGSVRAAETAAQCYALAAERNFEANQAKTEFMARVSHELRTPLTAIIGFSDVMRQQILGPLDDRYVGYTAGIHASGVKLLEIIDAILQMSRIEKGQFDFAPELLHLDPVVHDVIRTVRDDTDAKGVEIEADVASPMVIQADAAAIREILVQLVRNAVKFSHCEGRVRIRVRSANQRINVFVEDAGIGIAPELITELGRPFAQLEAEYNRSCGGAGLGLAIAQSLLEMHGGRLSLRSQPGIGTIALVSLPKAQPAANDAAATEAAQLPMPRLIAAE